MPHPSPRERDKMYSTRGLRRMKYGIIFGGNAFFIAAIICALRISDGSPPHQNAVAIIVSMAVLWFGLLLPWFLLFKPEIK